MESDWLKERREETLARTLSMPGLSKEQGTTLQRMDAHWARKGLSLATRSQYATRARVLGMWLKKPFEAVNRRDLEAYLDGMAKTHAPYTVALDKRFLKVFYKAILAPDEEGHPPLVSWIRQGKASQLTKRPQDMISREEVLRIATSTTSPRDRALVMVLYESAARAGEVVSLRVGDVELDQYGARLTLRGKTGMRKVRLIDSVFDLSEWLEYHPTRDDVNGPLFTSLGHQNRFEAMMHDGITRVIAAAVKAAGIKKRVHPHLFRHSRLTELAKSLSESELKVFAGWTADSPMAKVYIHLSGEDIDRKMLEKAGILVREEARQQNQLSVRNCVRCKAANSAAAKFCDRCRTPMDEAHVSTWIREQELLAQNATAILQLLRDPRVQKLLAEDPRPSVPA